jgi:Flp pilus assembly protein TadD
VLLKELGELTLAENLLLEVLQAEPQHAEAWSNLGVVLQYALRYDDAVVCHQNALQLAGPSGGRLNNLGNALTCALRLDEAVSAYRQGLELQPDDAYLAFNLSVALLLQGEYRAAWPLYEQRWRTIMQPRYREHAWQGQPLGEQHCWCGPNKDWAIPCKWHASCPFCVSSTRRPHHPGLPDGLPAAVRAAGRH